jgi:hypothetical protein
MTRDRDRHSADGLHRILSASESMSRVMTSLCGSPGMSADRVAGLMNRILMTGRSAYAEKRRFCTA